MELKTGYKRTELGMIPDDWSVRSLSTLAPIATGATPPTRDHANYGDEFLFVSPSDMGTAKYVARTEKMLSRKGFAISRAFPMGSVLFVCIGSTIGKCGIAPRPLTSNQQINAILPTAELSSDYLYYAISAVAPNVKSLAGQQAVPIVNKKQFSETVIALPPTKAEQEAIAEALSDADTLIESLERLMVKKNQLKQGVMHELLTGKLRVRGFASAGSGYKQTEVGEIPAEWDAPELGDLLSSVQLGGNYKNSEIETSWPLIKMGNLGRGRIKLDKIEFIDSVQPPSSRDRLAAEDVLFNTRNTLDLVGKVAMWRNELPEAYFNSNIMRMKFDEQRVSSSSFMNYILNFSRSLKRLRVIAIGTTSVAAIYGRDLVTLRIPLPTKPEQEAIAAVLSEMDSELFALEIKIEKCRNIRQGMMQELLTGRIRLV